MITTAATFLYSIQYVSASDVYLLLCMFCEQSIGSVGQKRDRYTVFTLHYYILF